MREILFRGKRKNHIESHIYRSKYKNGDWVYGLITKCHPREFWDKLNDEMTDTYGISGIEIDRDTVGQFTGLVDKNGEKIFEGDIIAKGFELFEVKWNPEQVRWGIYSDDYEVAGFTKFSEPYFEVIGNIYDNKELLEND